MKFKEDMIVFRKFTDTNQILGNRGNMQQLVKSKRKAGIQRRTDLCETWWRDRETLAIAYVNLIWTLKGLQLLNILRLSRNMKRSTRVRNPRSMVRILILRVKEHGTWNRIFGLWHILSNIWYAWRIKKHKLLKAQRWVRLIVRIISIMTHSCGMAKFQANLEL